MRSMDHIVSAANGTYRQEDGQILTAKIHNISLIHTKQVRDIMNK